MNQSSDIDFKDILDIYKKCNVKPCSFLVYDTTFPPDTTFTSLSFKQNLLERIQKVIMTADYKIRDEQVTTHMNGPP